MPEIEGIKLTDAGIPEIETVANADLVMVVDRSGETPATSKTTKANFLKELQAQANALSANKTLMLRFDMNLGEPGTAPDVVVKGANPFGAVTSAYDGVGVYSFALPEGSMPEAKTIFTSNLGNTSAMVVAARYDDTNFGITAYKLIEGVWTLSDDALYYFELAITVAP